MDDKYIKVIYASDPIGKEKIILELRTFDIEAFKRDESRKEIPIETKCFAYEFEKDNYYFESFPKVVEQIRNYLEERFEDEYEEQLLSMKRYIKYLRKCNENLREELAPDTYDLMIRRWDNEK